MHKNLSIRSLAPLLLFACSILSCRADVVAWGDSMTYGTGADHPDKGEKTWPRWFTEFSGIKVIKKGVGGESSQQIRGRMLAEPALHKEFTVIWAGRNDYSGPKYVKKHIADMVAALNHDNYLVVGITNSTREPKGGDKLKIIDTLNADLKAAYGSRFVDVRPLLVAAYDKTLPQDVIDHENDVVPASLRSDILHLNTAGYKVVAQAIYDAYRGQAPKPQEAPSSGVVLAPPDSKPIPVGVGKWSPAPHPYPSEFAKPPVEFRLWENGGAPGNPEPLHGGQNTNNDGGIAQWGIPSIVVWEPLKAGTNRKAFMICPGGAYQNIETNWRVRVDQFLQQGFVVFMLKYRTVPNWKECEKYSLFDAKRGIRFIRTYAQHYGIDPNRIGVVGGSAGANLVLNLITHPDAGNPKDEDILERPGCQVAFAAMLCPWPTPANRPVSYYPISKDTAPAFIASAKDDRGAPTSWAVAISDTYSKVGAPLFFWQIEKGGHAAFSAKTPDAEGYQWPAKFLDWLGKVLPDNPKSSP